MKKLPKNLTRVIVGVLVAAVVAGGVYFAFFQGSSDKTVTAQFESAVGVYPGTPVKILGVAVGEVSSVKPQGGSVKVSMTYDGKYKLPSNVAALLVANSLVSDRYVQLAPVYQKGTPLKNGGLIPLKRTGSPAELDDITAALNKLSVALGPTSTNKHGALATIVDVGAANLKGNGAALGNSISKLSQAAQTLAAGRNDLAGTVHNLAVFSKALKDSDGEVRKFNEQFAQVAGDLANERASLGQALHDLGLALDAVNSFVKTNAGKLHTSISGLKRITDTLVKQRASLNETVTVAPVALANIVHAYQPNIGVIATRGNLISAADLNPLRVCAILYSTIHAPGAASNILGPLTGTISKVCNKALGSNPAQRVAQILGDAVGGVISGGGAGSVGSELGGLLGGGLGGIIGTGGGA